MGQTLKQLQLIKFYLISLYQLFVVLSLANKHPDDSIFMPKDVGVMSVLLYVYDVHPVGCNKRKLWTEMNGVINFKTIQRKLVSRCGCMFGTLLGLLWMGQWTFISNENGEFTSIQINHQPDVTIYFPVYYPDVYLQLNIFRAFSRPLSGDQWLRWQPVVLPSYRGDSRAVVVFGPVITGPTTNTARLSPRYEGKTTGCHRNHWAPDDRWENARNMLSCK